jgi:GNAT superfamily N-acetyltransferase
MTTVTSTRMLDDGDTDEVLELMRLSLGESRLLERTTDLFHWKHIENPFGRSIGLVAEDGGQIVGLRTFMRWDLTTFEGETLRCARAVDTATHPDHQGKGIFRRLTEEAVEVARADGIAMIFNTPNEKSKPGYLKMGWREVGEIGALVRPSSSMLTRVGEDAAERPEVFLHDPAPAAAAGLVDRAPLGLRTRRTAEYLTWRFSSHPTARYFIAGQADGRAVLRTNVRRGRRELVVADLFGQPAAAARAATASVRSAYLATWFSRNSPERRALLRRGFAPIPGLAALTLVMRPLRDLPESYQTLDAWDTAVSDFELL